MTDFQIKMMMKKMKKLEERNKKLEDENHDLKFDNKNIQVENEVLKDNLKYAEEGHLELTVKKLEEENKKLKKYETMIHGVWSELYWKDKYGEDVGWKDISCITDYDEDFVKKEVVDDDEEEEEPNCCEWCGETMDMVYIMNKADKDLREKYDKYMGSPDDDGDICPDCLQSKFK